MPTSLLTIVQAGVTNKAQVQDVLTPLSYNFPATGRLSVSSTAPVFNGTGASLYYYPYSGSTLALKTGSSWYLRNFTNSGTVIPVVTGGTIASTIYDVYAYWTGTAVALELSTWISDSARNNSVVADPATGILVKSGDATRRFLGAVRTNSNNQFVNTPAQRFVWNYYNQVAQNLFWVYTGSSYNLAGGTTYRQVGGDTNAKIEVINGSPLAPDSLIVQANASREGNPSVANYIKYYLALNSSREGRTCQSVSTAFMTGIGAFVESNVSCLKNYEITPGYVSIALEEAEGTLSGWYSQSISDSSFAPRISAQHLA